jgi:hypothetical protein
MFYRYADNGRTFSILTGITGGLLTIEAIGIMEEELYDRD